jgi:hypothetical protein
MPRKDPTRPTGTAGLLVLHMDNKDSDENAEETEADVQHPIHHSLN